MTIPKLLNRTEFAQQLGISESSEHRGRQHEPNWPPHIRVGHLVFYREAAVEQWLFEQEGRTAPGAAERIRAQDDTDTAESDHAPGRPS